MAGASEFETIRTRPRVTVGMPVHNGELHLEAAIQSILAQTFADFELVLSDNASTDRTEEICRRFAALDQRVRYYRSARNIGAHRNHLRVFEVGRGEFFRWSGHDDVMAPRFLERCVEVLDRDARYVLAFTLFDVIDVRGAYIGQGDPPPSFADARPHRRLRAFWRAKPVHQVVYGVIRRASLEQTRLMGDWYASDRSLLIELALIGGFARIDEVLFHHREHIGRSDYQPNKQLSWAPETAGAPDLGHWKRLGHAVDMLRRHQLPPGEQARILVEYCRYGIARGRYWVPQLIRELVTGIRFARRRQDGPDG